MEEDKDCCQVWSIIAVRFDWMKFVDEQELLTMPHINEGGNKWFVNYCPACGAPARNRIMKAERLLTQRAADKCQKCGGSGSIKEDYNLRTCPRCDGTGICR